MKSAMKILAPVLAFGLLAGCSSLTVNYDYDTNVDWAKYRTYGWMNTKGAMSTNASSPFLDSDLLDKRIRSSVDWEMDARGIKPSDDPDILVVYHLGTEDKIQVTDWGYHYADYYWGYGGRQIDVNQYTEGTLVIDIVDAGTKDLVWRGIGKDVVDTSPKTPDQLQERIDKAVNKIMASFPPVK